MHRRRSLHIHLHLKRAKLPSLRGRGQVYHVPASQGLGVSAPQTHRASRYAVLRLQTRERILIGMMVRSPCRPEGKSAFHIGPEGRNPTVLTFLHHVAGEYLALCARTLSQNSYCRLWPRTTELVPGDAECVRNSILSTTGRDSGFG